MLASTQARMHALFDSLGMGNHIDIRGSSALGGETI